MQAIQDLVLDGVVTRPICHRALAAVACKQLFAFLERWSKRRKRCWQIREVGTPEPDLGLIRRGKQGEDPKWFFHYAPQVRQLVEARLARKGEKPITAAESWWLSRLQVLHEDCLRVGFGIAHELDTHLGLAPESSLEFEARHPEVMHEHRLRLLAYDVPQCGCVYAARPHYDRCFCTVHYAESECGLMTMRVVRGRVQLDANGQPCMCPANTSLSHCQVFLGAKATMLTAGRLRPMWHEVRQPDQGRRWAVVGFIQVRQQLPTTFKTHGYATAESCWPSLP